MTNSGGETLGASPGAGIAVACGGWAETQTTYRLLAPEVVIWEQMPTPYCDWSVEWMRRHLIVLCVQDRAELDST